MCVCTNIWTCEVCACNPINGCNPPFVYYVCHYLTTTYRSAGTYRDSRNSGHYATKYHSHTTHKLVGLMNANIFSQTKDVSVVFAKVCQMATVFHQFCLVVSNDELMVFPQKVLQLRIVSCRLMHGTFIVP